MNYEIILNVVKIFAEAFNLKGGKQNFHEIENNSTKPHVYEPINDMIATLKITKLKFVKKKLLE